MTRGPWVLGQAETARARVEEERMTAVSLENQTILLDNHVSNI
jgi:hypothetical protein